MARQETEAFGVAQPVAAGAQPYTWSLTNEEREWLRRLGFEQSPFTKTRWIRSCLGEYGQQVVGAWIDLSHDGWKLTTWDERRPTYRDTLGLELVPMLAFAAAEGWI